MKYLKIYENYFNDELLKIASSGDIHKLKFQYNNIGGNLNCIRGDDGNTLLHIAVINNNLNMVEWLLSEKVKVDVVDLYGYTPLAKACIKSRNVVDLSNTLKIMQLLIDHGANINFRFSTGDTPIMFCVSPFFNLTKILLLLRNGANIFINNNNGDDIISLDKDRWKIQRYQMITSEIRPEIVSLLNKHGILCDEIKNDPEYKKYTNIDELGFI